MGNRGRITGYDSVADAPIESFDFQRVHPRQVSTGSLRGAQTLSGDKIVIDSSKEKIGVGKLAISSDSDPLYALNLTKDGLAITDGLVTFISITKDGIVMNDGTTDRILIGKDEGGF